MVAYMGLKIQHKNGNNFLQGTKVNKFPTKMLNWSDFCLMQLNYIVLCKSVVSEGKELISNWPGNQKREAMSFLEPDWPIRY